MISPLAYLLSAVKYSALTECAAVRCGCVCFAVELLTSALSGEHLTTRRTRKTTRALDLLRFIFSASLLNVLSRGNVVHWNLMFVFFSAGLLFCNYSQLS